MIDVSRYTRHIWLNVLCWVIAFGCSDEKNEPKINYGSYASIDSREIQRVASELTAKGIDSSQIFINGLHEVRWSIRDDLVAIKVLCSQMNESPPWTRSTNLVTIERAELLSQALKNGGVLHSILNFYGNHFIVWAVKDSSAVRNIYVATFDTEMPVVPRELPSAYDGYGCPARQEVVYPGEIVSP